MAKSQRPVDIDKLSSSERGYPADGGMLIAVIFVSMCL